MSESKNGNYEVGFGRPPVHTRFRKGQSGNPKGRPKGSKNFKTDLEEELNERITVTIDGRIKKITKQRAFMKTISTKAIKGDARAGNTLVGMVFRFTDPSSIDIAADVPLSAQEEEALAELSKRLVRDLMPNPSVENGSKDGEEQ